MVPLGGIRVPDNIFTMVCDLCGGGHHEEQIILCDRCDKGSHLFCLSPPLSEVPDGEWICAKCVAQEADTAFQEGQECTLDEFSAIANDLRNRWFGGAGLARKVAFPA